MKIDRINRAVKLFAVMIILTLILGWQVQLTLAKSLYQTIPTAPPPTKVVATSTATITASVIPFTSQTAQPSLTSNPPSSTLIAPTSTGAGREVGPTATPLVQQPSATLMEPISSATASSTAPGTPVSGGSQPQSNRTTLYCIAGVVLLFIIVLVIVWVVSSQRKPKE